MKEKYFTFFILFLLGNFCFAQTKVIENTVARQPKTEVVRVSAKTSLTVSETPIVSEKIPLPKNQKNAPAVFYIVNDAVVDYKTYIHTSRNTKDKR